ncbi:MAG: hypothetical protein JNK90_29995 [Planctomycetaceae bacterium]|nr:hypothetical protein [Planctomycetaceae bacterium]
MEQKLIGAARRQLPWWLVSLLTVTSLAIVAAICFFFPHPFGIAILVLALGTLVLTAFFNPMYRYKLAYNSIVAAWLTAHSVPSVEIWNPTMKDNLFFRLSSQVNWSFDLACMVIGGILLLLDFRQRNPDWRPASIELSRWRLWSDNSSNTATEGAQQVNFGDVSGSNNQINISLMQVAKDFSAEIDIAASFLKSCQPDIAIEKLRELKRRHWQSMSDREKFRIAANLGNAHCQKDEHSRAADQYFEALRYQSEGEESLALKATAYFLQGNRELALEAAQECLVSFPGNSMARSVLIQSSPGSLETGILEQDIPAHLLSSPDILDALFLHASRRREYDKAEIYARKLLGIDQNTKHAQMRLGSILASKSIEGKLCRIACNLQELQSKATEAIRLLSEFISGNSPSRFTNAYARYHRALALEALGRNDEAEADLRSAYEILPDDETIRYQLGVFLVNHDKYELALQHFASEENDGPLSQSKVLWARLLLSRSTIENAQKVSSTLSKSMRQDPREDFRLTYEALLALAESLGLQGHVSEAEAAISDFGVNLPIAYVATVNASLSAATSNKPSAVQHAKVAASNLNRETDTSVRYRLADLLARLDEHTAAVEVYKTISSLGAHKDAVEIALDSAWKAKSYKYILELCAMARNNGTASKGVCEIEIATLEILNELPRALDRIVACLSEFDDDRFRRCLRLRQSVLGRTMNDKSLITYDPNLLPKVSDSTVSDACNTALILSEGPDPWSGIKYAYELVRNRFDDAKAHQCLLTIAGPMANVRFPSFARVEEGCAVGYTEGDETVLKWIIVEDGINPAPSRNEYAPSSEIAKELIGKKVGESFFVRRGIQDRIGKVQQILCKIEFRVRDSFVNWEELFREVKFIQSFKFKELSNGEFDVKEFLDTLSRLNEPQENIESLYRREPLSVGMFAKLMHMQLFDALAYLAFRPDLPVRCCMGTAEEYVRAAKSMDNAKHIVIDSSALTTVFLLGIWRQPVALSLGEGFLVTVGTRDFFAEILRNPSSAVHTKTLSTIQRCSSLETSGEGPHDDAIATLTAFLAWLDRNTTIVGGMGLAELSSEQRDRLHQLFDESSVESLATAMARDCVLWTDDYAIADQSFVGGTKVTERTWTAIALEKFCASGKLRSEVRLDAMLRLIRFDYRFTKLDSHILNLAIMRSRWEVTSSPLVDVLQWLAFSGVTEEGAIQTALEIIRRVWAEALLAHQRVDVSAATIKAVGQRADAISALQEINNLIPAIFGLDVVGIHECRTLVKNELAFALRGKSLILPTDPDWPGK